MELDYKELFCEVFFNMPSFQGNRLVVWRDGSTSMLGSNSSLRDESEVYGYIPMCTTDDFFEMCDIGYTTTDDDNYAYFISEQCWEWGQDEAWMVEQGIRSISQAIVEIKDLELFIQYVVREWDLDSFYDWMRSKLGGE